MAKQVLTTISGYQEYPKYKYQGANGVLVNSAEEEGALGAGYADAPTDAALLPAIDPRDAMIAELEAKLAAVQSVGSKSKS